MKKMLSRQTLKHFVDGDFSFVNNDPRQREIYDLATKIIYSLPASEAKGKTYSVKKIMSITDATTEPESVIAALNYLSTSKFELFRHVWFFSDEDEEADCIHELTLDDLSFVKSENVLSHPVTGERIENAKKYVYLSYERMADLDGE